MLFRVMAFPPEILKMEMFRRNCFWRVRLELRKDEVGNCFLSP